jgi:hypothetical protein
MNKSPARKRLPVIAAYIFLAALSLPIPLVHYYRTDKIIERSRIVATLRDGTLSPGLLPATTLLLRCLGNMSWWMAVLVLLFFALSFRRENYMRFTTICALAIGQCAFATIYAVYAAIVLAG